MSEPRDERSRGLARAALQLLALGALIVASLWIVRPFLIASVWAGTIAVSVWPLMLRAQAGLGGRRSLAVALLTVILLLVLVVPLSLGVSAIVNNAQDIASWSQAIEHWSVPQPPAWIERIPLVGAKLAADWSELAMQGPKELAERIGPYARDVALWLVGELGGVGSLVVNFLLTTVIAAILLSSGEVAASGALRFARRLAGAEGEKAARLAAEAIRAVALGVVLTAVIQSALVGLGFVVVGVPFAAILTALCFMLAVAQIGPVPILIGAVIWVYSQYGAGWGSAYLVWAAICGLVDNFLRPWLIKRGADLPLLLIFAGVIGGLLAFGVVGLFIGPVVLAVGYTLMLDWVSEGDEPAT
jgi:predicted PurR-regulated permease PerM